MDAALALATTDGSCGCAGSTHSSSPDDSRATFQSQSGQVRWSGILGVENEMTGDGRLIEANALRWDEGSLPLRYVSSDVGAHDGATVVGRIDRVWRTGHNIYGEGIIDLSTADGSDAARAVAERLQDGISMDLDDVSFEVRVAQELLDSGMDIDFGFPFGEDSIVQEEPETDDEGRVTVVKVASDEEVRVTTSGRVRAATLVSIPAFATARIALVEESDDTEDPTNEVVPDEPAPDEQQSLIASGFPIAPPSSWFRDPELQGPTPLHVSKDGRIYGHVATWDTCHVGHAHRGCITPPKSRTSYAHFHVGTIVTAEGSEIPVGRITLDTLHAKEHASAAAALAHYEHTGYAVADVAAGEDAYGIWIAGAARPSVTDEQVRVLRASPLSGDWRMIGGNLELVAALAVNTPGFPIPHTRGLVASGAVQSLVAANIVRDAAPEQSSILDGFSKDDVRYLKRIVQRERADEAMESLAVLGPAEELARRVRTTALAARRRAWKSSTTTTD